MNEYKLDIPSLSSDGIQMRRAFGNAYEVISSSIID